MMNEIVHRKPVDEDLQAAFGIGRLSFSEPWSEASIAAAMKEPRYAMLVTEYRGKVAAYAIVTLSLDEAELVSIAVAPEYRGLGIGKGLLKELLELLAARDISYVFLEVRISNLSAIRLYEGFGFKSLGIKKDFYNAPREDAFFMKKELR